jgi:peptidyl-tRNA hydrolase, PTH1 family
MTIIYGLGNNEPKYLHTKHNIGRILVEQLANNKNLTFTRVKNLMIAKDGDFIYAYSCDYMNTSGKFLGEYLSFIKPEALTLVVIHDDSDQLEGKKKLSLGGSSGGHNGIGDIHNNFKTIKVSKEELIRIKLGVRPEMNKNKALNFVLSPMTQIDELLVKDSITILNQNIKNLTAQTLGLIQDKFNK